ncbi:hypothetical protein MX111_05580 [Streptococcus uberis]|nr:hypothetical protein [Streptococcus uberis]MCK1238904.1 hypothetical protein [Streptococcus uberis]
MDTDKLNHIEELLQLLLKIIENKSKTSDSGIIQQKDLVQQLGISPNTLKKWENLGLKRLEPPIEDTRTVFYQWSDIIQFLDN